MWWGQVVAKSKIGSLQNANYKPGGGDKKIETHKIEIQAKSKIGSTANMKHVAGGGNVKVTLTICFYAQKQLHSLDTYEVQLLLD